MKFSNLGQILLASVVSLGLCLGVTSCSTSFTVGFLYVIGTSTTNGASGLISGFKINNNTGQLKPIKRSPFSSAGANPIRAVVFPGGRFVYVLNSKPTGPTGPAGGNIALFTVGGDGVLTFQASYSSQGSTPVSMAAGTGNFLYVLDQQVLDSSGNVLNSGNGAITVFSVDTTTGRLSLVTNQQVTLPTGGQLTYFPVGKKPTAFGPINGGIISSSCIYTVDTDQSLFPYSVGPNGQLALTPNGPQPTGATRISVIGGSGSDVFLLDAGDGTRPSTILPYTPGTAGGSCSLQTVVGGTVQNDPSVANPSDLVVANSKFLYIANAGPGPNPSTPGSGITGYSILPNATGGLLTPIALIPTGAQPVCILEDPSNQYIYTANSSGSTVTGRKIDTKTGQLTDLVKGPSTPLTGNATWCVVTSRTQ